MWSSAFGAYDHALLTTSIGENLQNQHERYEQLQKENVFILSLHKQVLNWTGCNFLFLYNKTIFILNTTK